MLITRVRFIVICMTIGSIFGLILMNFFATFKLADRLGQVHNRFLLILVYIVVGLLIECLIGALGGFIVAVILLVLIWVFAKITRFFIELYFYYR